MTYDEFVKQVQDSSGMSERGTAEAAARATLETLGLRLTQGEATDLASQLPQELADAVTSVADQQQRFSVQTFFDHVAQRAGIDDRSEAERAARAVLGVLSESVTRGQLADVFTQLPADYQELFTAKTL